MTRLAAPIAPDAVDPLAEDCLYWYAMLTPVWWMTGLLLPLGLAGVIVLFCRRLPRSPGILLLTLLWIGVTAMQAVATTINWGMTPAPPIGLSRALLSLATTGWMLIGLCIGIGGEGHVRPALIVRAICIQAGWVLAFALVSFATAYGLSLEQLQVPSPLALLLPSSLPIVHQQLTMKFFQMDSLMGGRALRLTLFYPWATVLSLAGATALLVATREQHRAWRWIGLAGGAVGTVFGHSRSVIVCVVAVMALVGWLRLAPRPRFGCLAALALIANVAILAGFDPVEAGRDFYAAFTEARSGSSLARYVVYELTWRHVLDSPIIGYGWVSGPAARWLPTMPLGSHSSFYGVLYLGGALTFAMLCIAFLALVVSAVLHLQARRQDGMIALALLLLIGVVANGETFQLMVPSLLLTVIWLGSALRRGGAAGTEPAVVRAPSRDIGAAPVPS